MRVQVNKNHGRYDLCSNEKEWLISVITPAGNVSETFDEDPLNYRNWGLDLEGALDAIEARVKSYWISSSRPETLAKIALIRARQSEFAYILYHADVERLRKELTAQESTLAFCQREIEQEWAAA